MTDIQEEIEIPDNISDLYEAAGGAPFNTILRVWREVLAPAEEERKGRITPQWANRIVTSYQGISFQDVPDFQANYFDKILELAAIVDVEIETDPECLNLRTPEEDKEHNTHHYLNIMTNWQLAFLQWEMNWDCMNQFAAVELAAMSEVHKMFFDQTGLMSLLDNIKFEFTDADRDTLATAMNELRESQED